MDTLNALGFRWVPPPRTKLRTDKSFFRWFLAHCSAGLFQVAAKSDVTTKSHLIHLEQILCNPLKLDWRHPGAQNRKFITQNRLGKKGQASNLIRNTFLVQLQTSGGNKSALFTNT